MRTEKELLMVTMKNYKVILNSGIIFFFMNISMVIPGVA